MQFENWTYETNIEPLILCTSTPLSDQVGSRKSEVGSWKLKVEADV